MDSREQTAECFELMQRLIEYRYDKPLHHKIMKAADFSMLSEDVLVLIYHMAKICDGGILEIGSFLGASTVAAGFGVRDSGKAKTFLSIEPGGALKDHKLATKNIFKDLTRNVERAGLHDRVTLLNGASFDDRIIATVKTRFAPGEVGFFIFDADANVKRDIDCYSMLFADGCWVVIDDYISATNKAGPTREQVDELVAAGQLTPLGFYGWGTWVGKWSALL
ncbi:MAG TPA: class I SAM-dependent methyltransferase [Chthoniobacterales bacterium]|jgi:predicted O-methyltransferase YrrM|nr:class I SAM-dependent methyltransferase [Chthoniobacterales bacterium]